jgi:hypothetical protein
LLNEFACFIHSNLPLNQFNLKSCFTKKECEIKDLCPQNSNLIKLTYFPLSVKKKGLLRINRTVDKIMEGQGGNVRSKRKQGHEFPPHPYPLPLPTGRQAEGERVRVRGRFQICLTSLSLWP